MISRKPAHLLLVDDDPGLLKLLGMRLTSEGYSVVTAESGRRTTGTTSGKSGSGNKRPAHGRNGWYATVHRNSESTAGNAGYHSDGAWFYSGCGGRYPERRIQLLTKPIDRDALYKAIDEALEQSAPATDDSWRNAIVTRSPLMLRLLEQARMVAQSDVSVLINGQSGTGKRFSHRRFIMPARAVTSRLSPLTAARYRNSCWSPNYSAMRAAPLPAQ